MADKIIEVQDKFQELNLYIRYVDQMIDSLVEETRKRNSGQVQEIKRLKRVQEHMEFVYEIRVRRKFWGGSLDVLERSLWRSEVEAFEGLLESVKSKEDRINKAMNVLSGGETRDNAEEEDYLWGQQVFAYEQGRHLDPDPKDSGYAGAFKGVDRKVLPREIRELLDIKDRVLGRDTLPLFERFESWLEDMEDGPDRREVDCLEYREYDAENSLCWMLVFLVLFVVENERHDEAFREFISRLKAVAKHGTQLIGKFLNLLEGADRKVEETKNLKRMTANILRSYHSMIIEEAELREFLEALLDGMEHLDLVLRETPSPRSDVSFSVEVSLGKDMIRRCEETVQLISKQIGLCFGPCYDEWELEVTTLIDNVL